MKKFLLISVAVLLWLPTQAATITGSLLLGTGKAHPEAKIGFTPVAGPWNTTNGTVWPTAVNVTTKGGQFSVYLTQGEYTVTKDGLFWRLICVDTSENTYSIHFSRELNCGSDTGLYLVGSNPVTTNDLPGFLPEWSVLDPSTFSAGGNTNDHLVLASPIDDLPATLMEKIIAGTNVVTELVQAGGVYAVKINASDPGITALTGDVSATGPGSAAATLASVGTAGTYGDATHFPVVTTDAKGRVTAVTTNTIAAAPTGANPTATIGNAAVNGSSANFMRADAAPAISTTATLQLGRLGLGLAPDGTSLLKLASTGTLSWDNGSGTPDVLLQRDAANTLALRNAANAQAFSMYDTYTDGSNYRRLRLYGSGGSLGITTDAAGTGGNADLYIQPSHDLLLGANSGSKWRINTSGHLLAEGDNTYDIGASAASRPRSVYVGTKIQTGGFLAGVKTTATNYTAAVSDRTILANGTTLTITLPTAVGATGQEYIVKVIAASTATVATTSSQNIDAATTYSLSAQYKYVKVQSDGTQWWIVGNN